MLENANDSCGPIGEKAQMRQIASQLPLSYAISAGTDLALSKRAKRWSAGLAFRGKVSYLLPEVFRGTVLNFSSFAMS